MGDHKYEDVFVDGDDLLAAERTEHPIPYRSIIIYRYYDEASKDFGEGNGRPLEHFAKGLDKVILRLREKICANEKNNVTPADFLFTWSPIPWADWFAGLSCKIGVWDRLRQAVRWINCSRTQRRTTASICASYAMSQ